MHLVMCKNRIINKSSSVRSVPTLELQAVAFGTEVLIGLYEDLCGKNVISPLKILGLELFTDNSTSLSWIRSFSKTFDKLNDKTIFVRNRLDHIHKLCNNYPVTYRFCAGSENPADAVTRPMSYKLMHRSNFLTGPAYETEENDTFDPVKVPSVTTVLVQGLQVENPTKSLFKVDRISSFSKAAKVSYYVLKFVNLLKAKWEAKNKVGKFKVIEESELKKLANKRLILDDQIANFSEIFSYFRNSEKYAVKDVPLLIHRLNIFRDSDGLLKVKAKFGSWRSDDGAFPVLLKKGSHLLDLIVTDIHVKNSHGGIYSVLSEFRKNFYVLHCFSAIKAVLKACIHCRKLNSRSINLSQSTYRDFRTEPTQIADQNIFIDMISPLDIKNYGQKS